MCDGIPACGSPKQLPSDMPMYVKLAVTGKDFRFPVAYDHYAR